MSEEKIFAVERRVWLIPKSLFLLAGLAERTGLAEDDVVNRAIQVYDLVQDNLAAGRELVFREPGTGREWGVEIR